MTEAQVTAAVRGEPSWAPDLSWRERRRAKVCGDKILVVCIRPASEPGWLYLERLNDIEDWILEGEPDDEWELKWVLMTRAEIDALPEHQGW